MKLHHALVSVVDLFQRAEKECWTYTALKERLSVIDKEFMIGGKLQREQFAYNELKSALFHELAVFKTTLAYEYKNKLYAVHKSFNGTENSTEVLHKLGLTTAEWDKMPRYSVWIRPDMPLYSHQ